MFGGPTYITPEEFDQAILGIGRRHYSVKSQYDPTTQDYVRRARVVIQKLDVPDVDCRCTSCGVYGVKRTWPKTVGPEGFEWLCPSDRCGKATVENWE